ncbi:universal stress protein [Roseibium aestuarii]|uniref:Universal stress protein n=1 Tax=Roseibium aestuarii TaxID=2600299 RepID=A0ABW4JZQ7_9HYPH|nr:universal stress protein [Roseibium aestuarii]
MFKTILVPVDPAESDFAAEALAKAKQFASEYGTKVHLLAVCPDVQAFVASQLPEDFRDQELSYARALLEKLAADMGIPVDLHVRFGTVYHEVLEAAEKISADLILMTSHKPKLSTYFIGSNAAHVVRHAPCSVMVLR